MPIALEVAFDTAREVLRALAVPFHVLVHGLRRRHWLERARDALAADAAKISEAGLERFAQRGGSGSRGHVFVSAGEASGEGHAANLVHATAAAGATARWTAFGGAPLRAAGADVIYPLSENAVMGIAGVLKSLPFVIGAHRRFLRMLRDDRPDLVVLVDYPGLHLVMARAARRRGIPVLHYIAPQYWGWGPWRMRRYRKAVDATLTILPFEAPFYAREGVAAAYVGHPLLDQLADANGEAPGGSAPLLCIMPGSRRKELHLHLAPMVAVARRLREKIPSLRVVLPHRDERRRPLIESLLREAGGDFVELHIGETSGWLRGARAVLVKSGTGSLEACLCGAPTVVVYVMHGWFARWGYKRLLNVPWFAGANLIANREVAPEVPIQSDADWNRAEELVEARLRDGPEREASLAGAAEVRDRLGEPGASARAAQWVAPFGFPHGRD